MQEEYLKKRVTEAGGVKTSPRRHAEMRSRWRERVLLHSPLWQSGLASASQWHAVSQERVSGPSCRWDALPIKVHSRSPAAICWGRREHVEWVGLAWKQCTDAGVVLIEVSMTVDTIYHAAVGAHLIDCLQEKITFTSASPPTLSICWKNAPSILEVEVGGSSVYQSGPAR